jgi:hypothetical protein
VLDGGTKRDELLGLEVTELRYRRNLAT